jgi:hypothetical protein
LQEYISDRPYSEGKKFFDVVILDPARCRDDMELFAAPVPAPATVPSAWKSLNDVQWMNIVNHGHAWEDYSKEDAVYETVKMVEAKLKEINAAPATMDSASPATRDDLKEVQCNGGKWDKDTLVQRLFNDPPDYSLNVEAGAKIQELRALVDALRASPATPVVDRDAVQLLRNVVNDAWKMLRRAGRQNTADLLEAATQEIEKQFKGRAASEPEAVKPQLKSEWESMCRKAVAVLNRHIVPEGISDREALNELYGIFDSEEYRATGAIEQDRCDQRQAEERMIDRTVASLATPAAVPQATPNAGIHVEHEDTGLSRVQEHCFFCDQPTRYWHTPTNNPCCQSCAATHQVGEFAAAVPQDQTKQEKP